MKTESKWEMVTGLNKEFEFGEWLLLDGKTECQYIQPVGNKLHSVDIEGEWVSACSSRLTKDNRYNNGRIKNIYN